MGAGDIGHALARYQGFSNRGFRVAMIFDCDTSKIGQKVGEFTIEDVSKMVERIRASKVKMAMVTVPAATAQEVTDKLVQAGVKAILNYAPTSINVPNNVHVQYIDPATHLQRMTYYLD